MDELAFQREQDKRGYDFAVKSLDVQATDRKDERGAQAQARKARYFLAGSCVIIGSGLVAFLAFTGHDDLVKELVKAGIYIVSAGLGGYAWGRREGERVKPKVNGRVYDDVAIHILPRDIRPPNVRVDAVDWQIDAVRVGPRKRDVELQFFGSLLLSGKRAGEYAKALCGQEKIVVVIAMTHGQARCVDVIHGHVRSRLLESEGKKLRVGLTVRDIITNGIAPDLRGGG